jgi:hypothetical protein
VSLGTVTEEGEGVVLEVVVELIGGERGDVKSEESAISSFPRSPCFIVATSTHLLQRPVSSLVHLRREGKGGDACARRTQMCCVSDRYISFGTRLRLLTFSLVPAKSMVLTPLFCWRGAEAAARRAGAAMVAVLWEAARAMDRTACFSTTCWAATADRKAEVEVRRAEREKDMVVWVVVSEWVR